MTTNPATDPEAVKTCSAAGYAADAVALLLGQSYHPDGLALTRRLAHTLALVCETRATAAVADRGRVDCLHRRRPTHQRLHRSAGLGGAGHHPHREPRPRTDHHDRPVETRLQLLAITAPDQLHAAGVDPLAVGYHIDLLRRGIDDGLLGDVLLIAEKR